MTAKVYQLHGLYLHNQYRKHHGSPKLRLDDRLNKIAEAYAQKLASWGILQHSTGMDYGENLYGPSLDMDKSKKDEVEDACRMWYNEKKYYNYNHGGFSMQTGHFTAMVWKETTLLGIGCACVNGKCVVVANYKVFPNMQGAFQRNVLPYREVEDSEESDEESEEEEQASAPKKNQSAEKKPAEGGSPSSVREDFKSKADTHSTIGWSELADILNQHIRIDFRFDGFEQTICRTMISMVTYRKGERSRIMIEDLENIWQSIETFVKNYRLYDNDRSGTLDPFELKEALDNAGFKITYKTFLTLQAEFGNEQGHMDFKNFLLCFLLLAKLQAVQEMKSDTGLFQDFSLKDWVKEQLLLAAN